MGRTTATRRTLPSHSVKDMGTDAHNHSHESSLFRRIQGTTDSQSSAANRHSGKEVRRGADDAEPTTGMGMGSGRPDGPSPRDNINHNSTPETPRTRAQNEVFHTAAIRCLSRDDVEPDAPDEDSGGSGRHGSDTSRDATVRGTTKRPRTNDETTRITASSRRRSTRSATETHSRRKRRSHHSTSSGRRRRACTGPHTTPPRATGRSRATNAKSNAYRRRRSKLAHGITAKSRRAQQRRHSGDGRRRRRKLAKLAPPTERNPGQRHQPASLHEVRHDDGRNKRDSRRHQRHSTVHDRRVRTDRPIRTDGFHESTEHTRPNRTFRDGKRRADERVHANRQNATTLARSSRRVADESNRDPTTDGGRGQHTHHNNRRRSTHHRACGCQ